MVDFGGAEVVEQFVKLAFACSESHGHEQREASSG